MSTLFLKPTKKEHDIIQNNKIHVDSSHPVDYKQKVCIKPWGYEFLTYESNKMAIWFLHIVKDHGTSLHTHFKKDTFIIVLSGTAKLTLIDNEVIALPPMSSVFLPKQKFHALSSFSDHVLLMEIEIFDDDVSFSNKNDLLRIDDPYHRKRTGYESSVSLSDDLSSFDYFYLTDSFYKTINQTEIKVETIRDTYFDSSISPNTYSILLKGQMYVNGMYLREGSILPKVDSTSFRAMTDCTILSINNSFAHEDAKLIYSLDHLATVINHLKKTDKKLVLTSGCYDILHVGHIHNLRESKKLGDVLIACLSNDSQIKKLKGENRPINNYNDRINLFKTITYVDYIVLYDEEHNEKEETLGKIMKCVQPYCWVKGNDYTIEKIMEKHPYLNKIVLIENIVDKSTTNIIKKITH
jgi:rfaE bifunctional protein nucleotidyltransferase chain/domain